MLFPIHRGIFAFTGFAVVEPFVVYGPGRIGAAEREAYLDGYIERLLTLDTAPLLVSEKGSTPAFETSTRER